METPGASRLLDTVMLVYHERLGELSFSGEAAVTLDLSALRFVREATGREVPALPEGLRPEEACEVLLRGGEVVLLRARHGAVRAAWARFVEGWAHMT